MIIVNELEKDSEEFISFHVPGSISIVVYDYYERGGEERWRLYFVLWTASSSSVLYDYYERGGEERWRVYFFLWASSSSRVVYDYYERGGKKREVETLFRFVNQEK